MQRFGIVSAVVTLVILSMFTTASPANAKPDEATYDRAYSLMKSDRCREAEPLFDRYIATVPSNDYYDLQVAHLNAGECYYETDGYAAAARHLDAAIALYPAVRAEKGENAAYVPGAAYFDAAYAHLQLGDYQKAVNEVTRGFTIDPVRTAHEQAFAYRTRGRARYFLHQVSGALSDVNESLKIEPNDYFALMTRGQIHRTSGDYPSALRDFVAANKVAGNQGMPWCEAGLTLLLQHRDSTARQTFKQCYALQPSLRSFYENREREIFAHRRI
jgi:tetratricopeptide (TPR) repeat protein